MTNTHSLTFVPRLSKKGKFFITIQQTPQGVIHFRRVSSFSVRPRWVKVGHPTRAPRFSYYLETTPHYEKYFWSTGELPVTSG